MCEVLNDELAPRLAGHVCKNLGAAIAHVLLDGGPVRWFSREDTAILDEDMDIVIEMFHAGGDGLDRKSIEKLLKPALEVVEAMSLDTGILIANLKDGRKHPLTTYSSSSDDPEVLLRILCHRKDHTASKYLKKEYVYA